MDIGAAFREALATLNVDLVRRLWAHVAPGMPQPKDDDEALVTLHHARLKCDAIPIGAKAYSLAYLTERELTEAEPVFAQSVGGMSMAKDRGLKVAIEGAMSRAVMACHAGGLDLEKDSGEVRKAMLDARAKVKAGRLSV